MSSHRIQFQSDMSIPEFMSLFAAEAGCVHTRRVVGALKYRKYSQPYLAAFAYRFNRGFDLRGLVVDVARTSSIQQQFIRQGHVEARF